MFINEYNFINVISICFSECADVIVTVTTELLLEIDEPFFFLAIYAVRIQITLICEGSSANALPG